MRVPAVLAQDVGRPPEVTHGIAGRPKRTQAGADGVTFGRRRLARPREELGRPGQPVGHTVEDARQSCDGAPQPHCGWS